METFISILRGINVAGQKKILMADLKKLYEDAGFKGVATYIQSGNVLFKAPGKISDKLAAKKIIEAVEKRYGFHVPIIMRKIKELQFVLDNNPYTKQAGIDRQRLYVTFMDEVPAKELVAQLQVPENCTDSFQIIGKDIYLYCPGGYGETKLSNNFFETKLKVTASTRNWNTCNILGDMAGKLVVNP